MNHSEIQKQICDRAISVPCAAFRQVDALVDRECPAGSTAEATKNVIHRTVAMAGVQQGGHSNGATVDHGVVGPVRAALKFDRVERITARLHPNMLEDLFVAKLFNRHSE